MTTTPILGISELEQNPENPDVTVNEGTRTLEVAASKVVKSRSNMSPPGGAVAGDRHIIPVGATGLWQDKDNQIAWFLSDWEYLLPEVGWEVFIQNEGIKVVWSGSQWIGSGGEGTIVDFSPVDVAVNYDIDAYASKLNLRVVGDCVFNLTNLPTKEEENPTIALHVTLGTSKVTWPVELDWGDIGPPVQVDNTTMVIWLSFTHVSALASLVGRYNPAYDIYTMSIVNPGDDPADTSGWEIPQGEMEVAGNSPNRYFFGGDAPLSRARQYLEYAADGVPTADIDAEIVEHVVVWEENSTGPDATETRVVFYDGDPNGSGTQIGNVEQSGFNSPDVWTVNKYKTMIPQDARWVGVIMDMERNQGSQNDGYWRKIHAAAIVPNTGPLVEIIDPTPGLNTVFSIGTVVDHDAALEPVDPVAGFDYNAVGYIQRSDWGGLGGPDYLAIYYKETWFFYPPEVGWNFFSLVDNQQRIYNGSAWEPYPQEPAVVMYGTVDNFTLNTSASDLVNYTNAIAWDGADASHYNQATGEITTDRDGLYRFTGFVHGNQGNLTKEEYIELRLNINGTPEVAAVLDVTTDKTSARSLSATFSIYLAAGDTCKLQMWASSSLGTFSFVRVSFEIHVERVANFGV